MQPSIKSDFEPEDLLGHYRFGIAVVDQQMRLLLANSAFFRLTKADPASALGSLIREVWNPAIKVETWLRENKPAPRVITVQSGTRSLDIQQAQAQAPDSNFKTLIVADASERLQLLDDADRVTSSVEAEAGNLRRRTEAAVLLRYFLSFAMGPLDRTSCLNEAARLGETLFPEGAAISVEDSPGEMKVVNSWGQDTSAATFATGACCKLNESVDHCTHTTSGPVDCVAIESTPGTSVVWTYARTPAVDEVMEIYIRAFRLAWANTTP